MSIPTRISIVILLTVGAATSGPVAAHSRHHSTGYWADESSHPALHYHDHQRRIRTHVAQQHCWEVPVHHAHHSDAELGGVLAGAVIGGLIGREFGNGRGRELATVGGALVGAELGRQAVTTHRDRHHSDETVLRCRTVHPRSGTHRAYRAQGQARYHRYNKHHD